MPFFLFLKQPKSTEKHYKIDNFYKKMIIFLKKVLKIALLYAKIFAYICKEGIFYEHY